MIPYTHNSIYLENANDNSTLNETFFDVSLFHNEKRNGFFSIIFCQHGEPKQQRTYKLSQLKKVLTEIDKNQNVWILLNEAGTFGRKKTDIARITCLFSDLDTYKIDAYKDMHEQDILRLVLDVCDENHFPNPTSALFSGRGLQLKWVFDEPMHVSPANITRFEQAQKAVQAMLKQFGSDDNAKDLSRVFRLAGTLHTGAQKRTYNIPLPANNFYKFSTLYTLLDELIEIPETVVKAAKTKAVKEPKAAVEQLPKEIFARTKLSVVTDNTRKSSDGKKTLIRKGLLSLNSQRYLDLKRLFKMRGNVEGSRMLFLAWIMNFKALAGQVNLENFHEQSKIEADLLFEDSDYDLNEMITVLNKFESQLQGDMVIFNEKSYVPLYTPKNRTLINIFSITADEQKNLKTIIDDVEKAERHKDRDTVRRRNAGAVPREEYLDNALSNTKPWEELGMSRATYYRRKEKGLLIEESVRQVPAVN